jgi:hypothetical protein
LDKESVAPLWHWVRYKAIQVPGSLHVVIMI